MTPGNTLTITRASFVRTFFKRESTFLKPVDRRDLNLPSLFTNLVRSVVNRASFISNFFNPILKFVSSYDFMTDFVNAIAMTLRMATTIMYIHKMVRFSI